MAHTLHVGDLEFPLYSTKITTPSINVRISNDVFYAPLVSRFIPGTMHVQYNDSVYSAPIQNTPGCSGANTHVGNYYFVGDCLVGVDDNVYLESTGTQYIDTEYITNTNGYRAVGKLRFVGAQNDWSSICGVFESSAVDAAKFGIYKATNSWSATFGADAKSSETWSEGIDYDFDVSFIIGNKYVKINNVSVITSTNTSSIPNLSMYIFRYNRAGTLYYLGEQEAFNGRLYYINIYDNNDSIVRQFIPVSSGMVIGDYTVPENGMWDIVEQKFYGNSGTGDFVYGVDQ